jgi:HK97 family phage major capsid protein
MNKATSELTFTEVGEHVALNGSKITYGQVTADLRKFRVLVPATNELTEDSAIDYWNDVTGAIGRARAKLADQLVFTDATSGLLSAGVGDEYITYSVGSALSDLTLDDLLKVPTLVKSSASRNGAFYMHRTVWSQIRREVASDSGIYLLGDPANSGRTTIDGFPVYLVDVMPSTAEVGDECAFACFGDLQRVKLYIKNQVDFKMYDQAVVLDSNGDQFNLATQDGEAISARTRMLATKGFESAFVIIGTDSVS